MLTPVPYLPPFDVVFFFLVDCANRCRSPQCHLSRDNVQLVIKETQLLPWASVVFFFGVVFPVPCERVCCCILSGYTEHMIRLMNVNILNFLVNGLMGKFSELENKRNYKKYTVVHRIIFLFPRLTSCPIIYTRNYKREWTFANNDSFNLYENISLCVHIRCKIFRERKIKLLRNEKHTCTELHATWLLKSLGFSIGKI